MSPSSLVQRPLVIGTRKSPLARAQTAQVEALLQAHNIDFRVVCIETTGDVIKDTPLYDVGGKALFSKEIERAMLDKRIDVAVHSLKDLEMPRPYGVCIAGYLPRADVRDVLITRFDAQENKVYGCNLNDLPPYAVIGTCAPRRAAQIHYHRPDIHIIPMRGNVGTRLAKLQQGACYGTLLAKAGLDRLHIHVDDRAILDTNTMVPAIGQGMIALECRKDDQGVKRTLEKITHFDHGWCVNIERHILSFFSNASCRSAIGVYVCKSPQNVRVRMMLCLDTLLMPACPLKKQDAIHSPLITPTSPLFFDKTYPKDTVCEDILDQIRHELSSHIPN